MRTMGANGFMLQGQVGIVAEVPGALQKAGVAFTDTMPASAQPVDAPYLTCQPRSNGGTHVLGGRVTDVPGNGADIHAPTDTGLHDGLADTS